MTLLSRNRIDVPCTVDIEQTAESLHAHAIAEGIDIRPGDRVIVHGAPASVGYGERLSVQCRATVVRAGWISRQWTQLTGLLALTDLYEVGFDPRP
jgi:hypothetical protein